ncbi:tRNA threonylcarbamoyladenosine biosynthesis protein TsaE [subsurface metagenome]
MIEKFETKDEAGTLKIAYSFGKTLKPGIVVALIGELGTGKTVFARGVANALGVKEKVISPSFTLINEYHGYIPVYHMDFYRLNSLKEILDLGVEDYLYSDSICLVEWAEKMGNMFPEEAIKVMIKHIKNSHRDIYIERWG